MKSLAQALGRVLPLAALISMLVTPSMTAAQTLEGDKNIDASMAIIDVKSQSELTVVQAPDLGQVVRPEGNDLCTYTVKSNGETNILDEDRISINGDIVNSPDPFGTAGCEFLSSIVPPKVELECPIGQRLDIGGSTDTNGVEASFGINGETAIVECADGAFALDAFVEVKLTRDSQLGAQSIVIPIDVLFQ